MFCENCGNQISDDSMFCENCGASVGNTAARTRPGTGGGIGIPAPQPSAGIGIPAPQPSAGIGIPRPSGPTVPGAGLVPPGSAIPGAGAVPARPMAPPYVPPHMPSHVPTAAYGYSQAQQEMTVGAWMISLLITSIPIVGFVMMLVWAFGNGAPIAKRNFYRAALAYSSILIVLSFLFSLMLI